jgi:hypothetical protein
MTGRADIVAPPWRRHTGARCRGILIRSEVGALIHLAVRLVDEADSGVGGRIAADLLAQRLAEAQGADQTLDARSDRSARRTDSSWAA